MLLVNHAAEADLSPLFLVTLFHVTVAAPYYGEYIIVCK